ncbi:mandelate racemase/muconate lactonizing enzyme family protein [Enterovirga sp. CN4-39]|uniref:mandelate racemase/muconate lactonizing enzyme family protein n=1 Tax=Enterovirga sp. CN4-39 TaxID=3400910 RepID=UPI003BFFCB53
MTRIVEVSVGVLAYEPAIQWPGASGPQSATIMRIRTAGGVEGVSVTWNDSPSPDAMALTIAAWFREALIGIDVASHPASTEALLKRAAWNGTSCVAVAAVDNALWDARGKAAGLPVHALLGTRHQSLPVYAASRAELGMTEFEAVADHVGEAREAGYRAYKLHLWGGAERDIAGCEFVRKRVGNNYTLMFDPLERYSLIEAVAVGRALERLEYAWFEDPIPADQRAAYAWLAERLTIPLVAADALQWSWNDYAQAAASRCPIMFRIDAGRQGITFASRIVSQASVHGVRCEIHAFGPEANSVAGLHVGLAQPLESHYEACFPRADFEIPGIKVPTALGADGRIACPREAGLGNQIDWSTLKPLLRWI